MHLLYMDRFKLTSLFCWLFICPLYLLGQAVDTIIAPPPPPPPPPPVVEHGFQNATRYMPLIRQCAVQFPTYTEQQNCTKETIIKIVYENLRWPGPDVCVEGMAVISFIVEKDGALSDFNIRRDPGQGTGEEALRVVKLMAEATAPWVPGAWGKDRKPVRIQYNVPVKFRLE